MMSRLGEPLSILRMARGSGLSSRTLHRVIRREHGVAPMALLRRARLARVRMDLQAPRPGTTVTTAAMRWGFSHLGRFSGLYAAHFGELPSATRRSARPHSRPPQPQAQYRAPLPFLTAQQPKELA